MWSAEWQAYHSHPQDAMHAAAFVRDRGSAPLHRGSTPLYSATMANADCGMRSAEWKAYHSHGKCGVRNGRHTTGGCYGNVRG